MSEPGELCIVLADDHKLVREALSFHLVRLAESVRLIEAATLPEAMEAAARAERVDLIILDIKMPGMNGVAGLARMRARFPSVPVVALSGLIDRETMLAALSHGAAGYLPKTLGGKAMRDALQLVLDGERFIPSLLLPETTSGAAPGVARAQAVAQAWEGLEMLTQRERQVLGHLVEGESNKEIARALGIEEVTVKLHLRSLFKKLGARNRTEAVSLALKRGWSV